MPFLLFIFFYLVLLNPLIVFAPTLQQITIYGISFFILVLNYSATKKYLYVCRKEILIGLVICLYMMIRVISGGESLLLFPTVKKLFLDWMPVMSLFILWTKKHALKPMEQNILNIGIAASLISLFLIMFPGVNDMVKGLLFMDERAREVDENRCYGFALGLTFSYPLVLSVISIFIFELKHTVGYKVCTIFLFIIAILFNARIGFVVMSSYFIVRIIVQRNFLLIFNIALYVILGIAFLLFTGLYTRYQDTFDWGLEFVYMISDFLVGTSYTSSFSHMSGLAGTFLVFPSSQHDWLVGSGIYHTDNSDIGFILQLGYGGICFLFLVYFLFFRMFYLLKKYSGNLVLAYTILLALLLGNWKGDVLYQSELLKLVFLLYIYYASRVKLLRT